MKIFQRYETYSDRFGEIEPYELIIFSGEKVTVSLRPFPRLSMHLYDYMDSNGNCWANLSLGFLHAEIYFNNDMERDGAYWVEEEIK